MFKNIDTVIFDMDGTLVDSMGIWEKIDRKFFAERNIPYQEDFQLQIAGKSIFETAEYFKKSLSLSEDENELAEIWNEMAIEEYKYNIPMKPGAISLLKFLKSKNVKLGLATSNSRRLVEACFEHNSLYDYIDVVVTADEVSHGKPEPDVYLKACELLNSNPEESLVFEDILQGIMAGKNAGMSVCCIKDDSSKHTVDKNKELSDYYINSFYDIEEVKNFEGI
ncbi:MAG: HAD family phosphatase [Lachnospiraceae bacterium]|nr:HAD family phosphatase [Lachnospiraceae bacterium]